mmetsp:Transcript_863/g.1343  ORF Transcript_863/g.1343 Transcript_863/m.1343 type:complete len:309 (+) Transcript_863:1180-2106(+)
MFHLDSWVNFNEIRLHIFCIDKEFHSTCVLVVGPTSELLGILMQSSPQFIRKRPSRCHFNNLLMPSLHTAITFVQMNDVTRPITNNLDLNMTRTTNKFLYKDTPISKRCQGFRRRRLEHRPNVLPIPHNPHSLPAAAHGSLQNNREAIFIHKRLHFFGTFERPVATWYNWHIRLDGGLPRARLVTKCEQIIHRRTDEFNPILSQGFCKLRVFAQETVAGVDCVDAVLLGNFDNLVNVEVGGDGGCEFLLFEEEGLVSSPPVLGVAVLVAVDGDGLHVQLGGGPHNAHGDFGPVGCHDLVEGFDWPGQW